MLKCENLPSTNFTISGAQYNFSKTSTPQSIVQHGGVLVSVKFDCFSPSRFSHFHCNATRKAIKAHKNLHTN